MAKTKKEKMTMNLTIEDVKHIVRLATAVKYPVVSQSDYDWRAENVDMLYQNSIPEHYNMLVRQHPEIAKTKWGKELEVRFHSNKMMLTLRIQANGYVVLETGLGNAHQHDNPLPIAAFLIDKGYPLLHLLGDEQAQQLA